jgi:hypothetical protein
VIGVPVEDVVRTDPHLGYVAGDVALWPQLTGIEVLHLLRNLSGTVNASRSPGVDNTEKLEFMRSLGADSPTSPDSLDR